MRISQEDAPKGANADRVHRTQPTRARCVRVNLAAA